MQLFYLKSTTRNLRFFGVFDGEYARFGGPAISGRGGRGGRGLRSVAISAPISGGDALDIIETGVGHLLIEVLKEKESKYFHDAGLIQLTTDGTRPSFVDKTENP